MTLPGMTLSGSRLRQRRPANDLDQLSPRFDFQLSEDVAEMSPDGPRGDAEDPCNRLVGLPFADEPSDLELARGKLGRSGAGPSQGRTGPQLPDLIPSLDQLSLRPETREDVVR